VLRDVLNLSPSGSEIIDSPLIDILGFRDIKCSNPIMTFAEGSLAGTEIIARTIGGTPCGFSVKVGLGNATYIGTWLGFDTEGHKPVYEALLKRSGASLKQASSDNDYLTVRERFAGNGKALLFIANYYNEERSGTITYTHPESGEAVNLPLSGKGITWPGLYSVLTPVCLDITKGLKILHSSSDILGLEIKDGVLNLTLSGDRDLQGETVFEGHSAVNIRSAEIDGTNVGLTRIGDRIALTYSHEHKKGMVLKIRIN
jgi:hypothetical protein